MTQALSTIAAEWLLNPDRIRLSRSQRTPTEQDIEDVLAILQWPDNRHYLKNEHTVRIGASVLLTWKWQNEKI